MKPENPQLTARYIFRLVFVLHKILYAMLKECITIQCTLSMNGQWEPVVNGHRFGWSFYASISESDTTSPYLSN